MTNNMYRNKNILGFEIVHDKSNFITYYGMQHSNDKDVTEISRQINKLDPIIQPHSQAFWN